MLFAVCINHAEQTTVARKEYFSITRRLSNKVHDLLGTLQKSSVGLRKMSSARDAIVILYPEYNALCA